ncbi:Dihydrolipoyllysine-residue succinyltransferase component of 2-oxoglutarate dehydrogenase [Fasciola hepatica]|uniref:Dihydrolipoyllysine-residue succinyltransferase component of 2-oxoglutarate dehydrogenase n=1 Tax=Fasciola hepatica TaxID=6192 RepID=A0A2H1BWC2_FASHE|nr:Dihydrolipoyllysine-residue succinyltransferase component of 2-oxoglutarate dehydrogenase [Fasciola hepatica]
MSRGLAPALRSCYLFSVRRHRAYPSPLVRCFATRSYELRLGVSKSATIRYFDTSSPLNAVRSVSVFPFAESVTEGDIIWKKAVGERVRGDEVVAEIETDKTNVPVPAPCSGVVTELLVDDGGKVVPGQEIFKVDDATTGVATKENLKQTLLVLPLLLHYRQRALKKCPQRSRSHSNPPPSHQKHQNQLRLWVSLLRQLVGIEESSV